MRLLMVGGLSGQLSTAAKIAMNRGAKVAHAESAETALADLLGGRGADLVMIDVAEDVAGFIETLKRERVSTPVVACGVQADADAAVAAIKAGAKEFVPLPPDADLIAAVIEAVSDDRMEMIAEDPAMQRVVALARQVAASDASILITGESGSGKEVMARYVHARSRRKDRPFISVNCAAIPENLLESELFGHEKGAFTGAMSRRVGKFEEADGGTLLLDEISEMDVRLQAKLLRAIQERVIDRVGGSKPVRVDIRILATSNRDLTEEVRKGTFREDLMFRLNVVNLKLPALRERPSDIVALARHFAAKYAEANGAPERALSEAAQHAILKHQWPGNVRELENAVHRAVILAQGPEIDADALRLPDGTPLGGGAPRAGATRESAGVMAAVGGVLSDLTGLVGRTVADVERDLILDTLDHCLGNRTHAANILGISIRTLRNKLKQYTEEGREIPAPGERRVAG